MADWRAVAEVGVKHIGSSIVATRGERLGLYRLTFGGRDQRPEAFQSLVLGVGEVDANSRITASIMFDADRINDAFAELEARYVAGEAAEFAQTWSAIVEVYAAFNRRELPTTTPTWTYVDHRSLVSTKARDLGAYINSAWEATPDLSIHVEAVHRLTDFGAVLTHTASGTSREGFGFEWRMIHIYTVEGTLIDRCEMFDEQDLDAALTRFDELHPSGLRLENAASRAYDRLWHLFETGDWRAVTDMFIEDIANDDRRRVVNAGIEYGRHIQLENLRRLADIGATISTKVVATRGDRLTLNRFRTTNSDLRLGEFDSEMLTVIETDVDNRIAAGALFESDDLDAAFEELDARYLAGEAAPYAPNWSAILSASRAFNRREMFPTTADWVNIDHRRVTAFTPGDMAAYVRATWDVATGVRHRMVSVHRLTGRGAVLTQVSTATSRDSFEAEWHEVVLLMMDSDAISRCEIFDEVDLEAAVAKFNELNHQQAPQLENAATRKNVLIVDAFNRRDVDAYLATVDSDARYEDRRKGLRSEGPIDVNYAHAFLFGSAESWRLEIEPVAVRGHLLALSRYTFRDADETERPIAVEALVLTEVGEAQLIYWAVVFDTDDVDDAFAELDSRYGAGEAAPHARAWSAITRSFDAFNSHELPSTTLEWIDRRRLVGSGPSDLGETAQAAWDMTMNIRSRIESVHRLNDRGAVITQSLHGTSAQGLDFESRMIDVFTIHGDAITRCEMFDETDLEVTIAEFDGS